MSKVKILLVDDESRMRKLVRDFLEKENYEVFEAGNGLDALDIFYETVSTTATVGLTRNLTSSLNNIGKSIIILTMYLGRVGPISLAIAFSMKKTSGSIIKNPSEDVSVG